MTEPRWPLLAALALPMAAVALMLLWAAFLRRRGRFDGGVGRLHGLGRHFDTPRRRELALDFAALGSSTVVTLFTGFVAVLFWLADDRAASLLMVLASSLGALLGTGLKKLTRRLRPEASTAVHFGSSFPSSHTLMGSTLYGTAAVLAAPLAPPALAAVGLASALLLSLLIGASRVVLRVHYVSDVMAGWWVAGSLVAGVALLRGGGA